MSDDAPNLIERHLQTELDLVRAVTQDVLMRHGRFGETLTQVVDRLARMSRRARTVTRDGRECDVHDLCERRRDHPGPCAKASADSSVMVYITPEDYYLPAIPLAAWVRECADQNMGGPNMLSVMPTRQLISLRDVIVWRKTTGWIANKAPGTVGEMAAFDRAVLAMLSASVDIVEVAIAAAHRRARANL